VNEDDVLGFVQRSIKSVWALELLLLLRRDRQRIWRAEDMVLEMRSSDAAVGEALAGLRSIGFVTADSAGLHTYQPASAELDRIAERIQEVYAAKPLAVVKAITSAPNDKLRLFSDSFKLKDR
jgi:hypothetical protein